MVSRETPRLITSMLFSPNNDYRGAGTTSPTPTESEVVDHSGKTTTRRCGSTPVESDPTPSISAIAS